MGPVQGKESCDSRRGAWTPLNIDQQSVTKLKLHQGYIFSNPQSKVLLKKSTQKLLQLTKSRVAGSWTSPVIGNQWGDLKLATCAGVVQNTFIHESLEATGNILQLLF